MTSRKVQLQELRVRRLELEAEMARLELDEMKLFASDEVPGVYVQPDIFLGIEGGESSAKILRFVAENPKCSSGEIAESVFGASYGDRRYHFLIRKVLTQAGFEHRKSGSRRFWMAG